jgi:hypothetical protein
MSTTLLLCSGQVNLLCLNICKIMKELIITWSQTPCPLARWSYWGLGDMLRGTLSLYRLAKKRGYKLTVDTHLHPLSNFTTHSKSYHSEFIDKRQPKIHMFHMSLDLEREIECADWLSDDKLFCMCNHGNIQIDQVITPEEQEFLKSIIEPTLDVQTEIDQLVSTLPENYTILNVRFSEERLKNNPQQFNLRKFKFTKKPTDVLISNSLPFKKQMNVPFMNHEPGHIGYEKDLERVKSAFIEFHIMANGKEIRTYSEYSWVSGYALWAGKLYNVPIVNLNPEIKENCVVTPV